jgi:FkbM family methyltransferase
MPTGLFSPVIGKWRIPLSRNTASADRTYKSEIRRKSQVSDVDDAGLPRDGSGVPWWRRRSRKGRYGRRDLARSVGGGYAALPWGFGLSFNKIIAAIIKRVPLVNRGVYSFAQRYIDAYRDYSYDFRKNGEAAIVRRLREILPPDATIFDVGVHRGSWADAVKGTLPRASVHCFELSGPTFRNLQQRLGHTPGVILNNFGLSDRDAEVAFRDYGENHVGNTLITDPCYVHKQPPQMATGRVVNGDRYCRENQIEAIDFLKIDVEGWEYFVLEGFRETLGRRQIRIVQFEYGYVNADVHTLMRDFYRLFELHGMRVGRLTPAGVAFSPFHHALNDFKSGPNFIACQPDLEQALGRF